MILYINACVRPESRTNRLAKALLAKLGEYEEVNLAAEPLEPLNNERLALRTELIAAKNYGHDMFRYARQFAAADTIVIGAPFWDFSFPALLKIYLENIYVTGLVSYYNEQGIPVGLCRAKKLYYVTTAGGAHVPNYGYFYVRDLAQMAFGIPEAELVQAEMLDIVGNDAEAILKDAVDSLRLL